MIAKDRGSDRFRCPQNPMACELADLLDELSAELMSVRGSLTPVCVFGQLEDVEIM